MATVNSVLGPVNTSELGFTLIHEHLLIGWAGWQWDNVFNFNRAEEMAKAVDRLQELKALGVSTFVDPCPMDIGRDPEFQAEASQKSGMRIISSTGLYHHEFGIPAYFHAMPDEQIAEIFIKDLTEGMAHTGIKAGIIKCATTAGKVTDQEAKAHRAAGMAQVATGSPIITHTDESGPMGLEQLNIFDAAGVKPHRVAIGHSCGNGNLRYLLNVLDRGAWLSFDRFGFGLSASDEVRVAALLGLIGVGHANRVMISHDSVCTILSRSAEFPPEIAEALQNWNPTHIIKNILPRLREAGVTEQTIQTITVDNPRRYFEGGR
ncbi:MAG: phosphotriesterase [Dehalococcoidia bacterium]